MMPISIERTQFGGSAHDPPPRVGHPPLLRHKEEVSILIVDDEEPIRYVLVAALSEQYLCLTAASAEEALQALSARPVNLVLADIQMAGASGIALCKMVHKVCPDTVVLMVSGLTDIQYAIEAMKQGAFDYITKPFDLEYVRVSVARAASHQALLVTNRNYQKDLEETVRERTAELRLANMDLSEMLDVLCTNYRATLRSLAKALEARDAETAGHADRVVAFSLRIGKEMGLPANSLIALEQGALLHDIGKIGVPDAILLKPAALSQEQWTEMRKHISYGLTIIEGIDFLSGARAVVGQHHEKYDGSGYPAGLVGDLIHINARIFAVADAFDAMTSDRPYRAAMPFETAQAELVANAGSHFDPTVVKAFLGVPEAEWAHIRRRAASTDYLEQVIGTQPIRSFIASLKTRQGRLALSSQFQPAIQAAM